MTDDVRKLLGGYATNTLTESERRLLFDASLDDPALFEALADEQALRDLLDDPGSRAELLAHIDPAPLAFRDRFAAWLRRPVTAAVLGTAAVAITAVSILPLLHRTPAPVPVQEIAKALPRAREEPAPPTAAAPRPVDALRPAPLVEKQKLNRQASEEAPANRPEQLRLEAVEPTPAAPAAAPAPLAGNVSVEAKSAVDATVQTPSLQYAAKKADEKRERPAVRYAVLKRSPSGDYIEVPPDTEFDSGDTVRVRVETSRPSLVTIMGPGTGRMLFTRQSTGVVETGDILLTADQTLEITETPGPSVNATPGGVIGGYPGAMLRDKMAESSTAPAAAARKVAQAPTVTILLHVKKR